MNTSAPGTSCEHQPWQKKLLHSLTAGIPHEIPAQHLGIETMAGLVQRQLFQRGFPVDGFEYLCLEVEGELVDFGVVKLDQEFICNENREAAPRMLRLPIEELRLHTLNRERFYALLAQDLGISGQVLSLAPGVWEVGRRTTTTNQTAKVIFVESGVSSVKLQLLLATDTFLVFCLLHHGGISAPPKITGKAVACARVEVVEDQMVTDAFIELESISLPPVEMVDLSKQMEQGFNSLRKQVIDDTIAANEMRKELEEFSGNANDFMAQLVAGFGADKEMVNLFMLLQSVGKNGKPLPYSMVGQQMGITKQAIEARFKKMGRKFPSAYRYLQAIRTQEKTTQFSAISPKERREKGIDASYDYDVSD